LLLVYKPVPRVTVLNAVASCNTVVGRFHPFIGHKGP
jgi:hypothetical protein